MVRKYGLYFSWLLASVAILGSLYFSQIRGMDPCNLCWYQRISLFPLGIILGIACYKGFMGIAPYALPLVFIGMLFAGYQVAIQQIPEWNPIELCGSGPKCTDKIQVLGPLTLPMLSLGNFIVLAVLLLMIWSQESKLKNNLY